MLFMYKAAIFCLIDDLQKGIPHQEPILIKRAILIQFVIT